MAKTGLASCTVFRNSKIGLLQKKWVCLSFYVYLKKKFFIKIIN